MIENIKTIITKSVGSTVLVIISITHIACGISSKPKRDKIQAICIAYKWQFVDSNNYQIITISDTATVYYYRNLILYQISSPYEKTKVRMDSTGDIISEKLIQSGVRYSYFIYKDSDSFGLKYDPANSQNKPTQIKVNLFLQSKGVTNERMFHNENDSLVETKAISHDIILEKYIPKIKYDETYPDSVYLYFSKKMNNIKYTFSKQLDSLKKAKLFKSNFVYNPVSDTSLNIPRRELLFQIEETKTNSYHEIIKLFEKFQKEYPIK